MSEKVLEEMPLDEELLDLEDIEKNDNLLDLDELEDFKEGEAKPLEEPLEEPLMEMEEEPLEEIKEEEEQESEEEPEETEEESEQESEGKTEEEVSEEAEEPIEESVSDNIAGTAEELLAFHSDYTEQVIPIEDIHIVNEPPFFNRQAPADIIPVVYKDKNGNYQLIAGGLQKVRVVEADDDIAKLYRTDYRLKTLELPQKDIDDAIADEVKIYQKYDASFDEAAQSVADLNFMDKDDIKAKVLIRELAPELKAKVEKGISFKQAELLLKLNKTQQKTVAETMDQLNLNVITTEEAQELVRLAENKELSKPNARITLDHDSVFIKKSELNDLILRLTTSAVKEIEDRGAITVEE